MHRDLPETEGLTHVKSPSNQERLAQCCTDDYPRWRQLDLWNGSCQWLLRWVLGRRSCHFRVYIAPWGALCVWTDVQTIWVKCYWQNIN